MTTTTKDSTFRRQLLRETYRQVNMKLIPENQIDFIFVFGNAKSFDQDYEVAFEEMTFPNDTFITEREENMNDGKTLDWFMQAQSLLWSKHPTRKGERCLNYKFVGKTDEDTAIQLPRLSKLLNSLPSNESHYIGRRAGVSEPRYMAGMLYIVSADIVDWIHSSPIPQGNAIGHEDHQFGLWLHLGGWNEKLQFHSLEQFHDVEETFWSSRQRVSDKSIVVHLCKDIPRMFQCFGDLYGTPPLAVKRLLSPVSLKHRKDRLKELFPSVESIALEKDFKVSSDVNAAAQIDAVLIKNDVKDVLSTIIATDKLMETDWIKIARHMMLRFNELKREEMWLHVLQAVVAMDVPSSDTGWEKDVANRLAAAAKEKGSPLSWEKVKEIRGY
ncbi:hypothetical protein BCR33DRAFT_733072 [Rhizoclosmatium globosum]|uniref:Hexosyltransferase n=1 Tax=Rhizoclosmatium globosum TaxID=329046 RepID=A0A1Y2CZ87_9FUNG|nr:hypothetical protein BCR33DRAFT_733072 [Rhizoclosmatium globosum]|eukprot:ORY52320.1 hypothetical protein BCR33DRAFT_733072 [Rhizoclosmatium globosum]